MRCDLISIAIMTSRAGFQSLLGFLMRCDTPCGRTGTEDMFQSLLGFLMRCDLLIKIFLELHSCFNPCWVF